MVGDGKGPGGFEPDQEAWEEQLEALEAAQRVFVERHFKWLVDYVTSYFPEDSLAAEDVVTDVHFLHTVVEDGKPVGMLVYRFRKARDREAYFGEMAREMRKEWGVPEVLFVDTETPRFDAPAALPREGAHVEMPEEALCGRIRELREELKRRSKLRALRDSLSS
jgi:hypothetical protein